MNIENDAKLIAALELMATFADRKAEDNKDYPQVEKGFRTNAITLRSAAKRIAEIAGMNICECP